MFQSAFIAFLPFLFFTVCVLIPLSFPSHSPLTGRPRHWREQRSLYLRLLVRKCQLFNWLPREASVKIPSLPSTGKTSDRNGISPSPCPTGGGWWHFSDQELAQPPPGTTEGPFARSPLHLWTKSLYSHFMAQRRFAQTQTIAGGCRRRILRSKGRRGCGCSRGSSILHPAFQPQQTLWMHQLLLTPFASYLLLPACLLPSLSHDPRSVDGCMTPSGSVSPPRDKRGATPPELRAFLLADSRSDGIYLSLPQCTSTCITCCHLVLVSTARIPPPGWVTLRSAPGPPWLLRSQPHGQERPTGRR